MLVMFFFFFSFRLLPILHAVSRTPHFKPFWLQKMGADVASLLSLFKPFQLEKMGADVASLLFLFFECPDLHFLCWRRECAQSTEEPWDRPWNWNKDPQSSSTKCEQEARWLGNTTNLAPQRHTSRLDCNVSAFAVDWNSSLGQFGLWRRLGLWVGWVTVCLFLVFFSYASCCATCSSFFIFFLHCLRHCLFFYPFFLTKYSKWNKIGKGLQRGLMSHCPWPSLKTGERPSA